jgi:transcriptional regulator with XRE-family HTH domain
VSHQQEVADRLAQLRREKSAREHRDVLQSEIADYCGISTVTYGRYEGGRRKVPSEVVIALAKFYGVSPGFISFGETSSEAPYGGQVSDERIARARAARDAKIASQRPPKSKPNPGKAAARRRRGNQRDER